MHRIPAAAAALWIGLTAAAAISQPAKRAAAAAPTAPAAASLPTESQPQIGLIAYYDQRFAGRRTVSGEEFDPEAMTMSHRTLAFGTRVRVTNLVNGKSVIVRVNDRLPTRAKRIADLSLGAAERIDMIGPGIVEARLEILRVITSR